MSPRIAPAVACLLLVCLAGPAAGAQPTSAALILNIGLQGSLTWATFIHRNGQSVSFHPV